MSHAPLSPRGWRGILAHLAQAPPAAPPRAARARLPDCLIRSET